MSDKVKRESNAPLVIEETFEALSMNPIQTFEKEIPVKPKRKLRVSISVAVSSGSSEAAGSVESKPAAPDASCAAKYPPARFSAYCPLEEPVKADMENVGGVGGLYEKGVPERQNFTDNSYSCDGGSDGLLPCCKACENGSVHDCSLDRCSLVGDTTSVDSFTDDWTDSVSNYVTSRRFITRLFKCFCCLKPHDD